MLIKLSDGCFIAHDQIAELKVNDYTNTVMIRMKDGIGHCYTPEYNQGVYEALDILVDKINSIKEN